MNKSQDLVFELLKICTGTRKCLLHTYTDEDWMGALGIAKDQAIVGVLMTALESLDIQAPKLLLLQWIGRTQLVERRAAEIAEVGSKVINYFHENGFACQILKGSAVARYYPQPNRRTSGDIDVWLDGGRKKIYAFARAFDKDGMLYGVNYHHIHFHLIEREHIEVHVWPAYLNSPLRNHRLHQFCEMHKPTMESSMPSLAFDRVFILLHCFNHFCGHGVGLRQFMDYYYVLRQGFTEEEKKETVFWIERLGLKRFAGGMMWVLREVFGIESQHLIMEPNEKEGRFILNEVLLTGNMGHADTRFWGSLKTPLTRFFFNLRRDIYLLRHYPHETMWQPFFSLWLYAWRWSKGLLKSRDDG